MVIHYLASQGNVACGRTGASISSAKEIEHVTCKLCRRSVEKQAREPMQKTPTLAELRAAAKIHKAAATTPESEGPFRSALPRAEWRLRLEQLQGRNRLPRGELPQLFV